MVGRILKKKTLKSLLRCYQDEIPKFFGFKDIAIMFHDNETKSLYTITLGDLEEAEFKLA